MKMRFGLSLGVSDVGQAIKDAVFAEKCGFDGIWMADHIRGLLPTERWGEAWTILSAIAARTRRVRLYCCVTDPLRRHPAQTAQTVATLDQISNGRVGVGIGAGESMNLLPFGIEWRNEPLLRLREAAEVIKLMLESSPTRPVNYDGKFYQLVDTFLQIDTVQKPRPPVFIGALGKRNREMVGEISDGWCSWFQSLQTLQEGIQDIRIAAEKAGRKIEDIEIALAVPFAISDEPEEAYKALEDGTKQCLIFERNILRSMGYYEPFKKDMAIQWALPTKELSTRLEQAKKFVPREAVEAVSAFGNAENCIRKIEERAKLGVDWVIVGNNGPNYKRTFETFKKNIIPYFR